MTITASAAARPLSSAPAAGTGGNPLKCGSAPSAIPAAMICSGDDEAVAAPTAPALGCAPERTCGCEPLREPEPDSANGGGAVRSGAPGGGTPAADVPERAWSSAWASAAAAPGDSSGAPTVVPKAAAATRAIGEDAAAVASGTAVALATPAAPPVGDTATNPTRGPPNSRTDSEAAVGSTKSDAARASTVVRAGVQSIDVDPGAVAPPSATAVALLPRITFPPIRACPDTTGLGAEKEGRSAKADAARVADA